MANFPPLAPVPPPQVQLSIPSHEWELYTEAWTLLLGMRIEASDAVFSDLASKDESAVPFLNSFYRQLAVLGPATAPKARTLRKLCFLLTRRYLLDAPVAPLELLEWDYLGSMCSCYPSSAALKRLLSDAWSKHADTISSSLEKAKSTIIKHLTLPKPAMAAEVISDIRLLTLLASALPPCGQVLMAGADFLDTFSDAYQTHKREDIRKVLVANIYVGLTSLLKGPSPNLSLLLDQLFSLKASAGVGAANSKKESTLLSDLICSSDLLTRIERYLAANPQKRAQDLLASLHTYQGESRAFHHRYQKQKTPKTDKGKGRAPASEETHIHKMSLVTQVQDLFPDLGAGYIVHLLDHYDNNPETVVAHLLDDSLPPHLQSLDKSEPLASPPRHDPMPPHATPPLPASIPSLDASPPTRKNIFDSDVDLAELSRSEATGKLHFGRANQDLTADAVLADRSDHAAKKAAIMSALATFDSDDDERDDTYDVADVGGTVDNAATAGTSGDADADAETRARNASQESIDMALFRAYRSSPGLFARDSATRRSQPRASLKRETGMTDEAIEGWAVMLARDPKRLAKLEDRMALMGGGAGSGAGIAQPELKPTAYRRPAANGGESDEDDDGPSSSFARGRGGSMRGRGRGGRRGGGGGGRGRGGGAGAGSGDPSSAASRQKKEENKSSRANHNRRQQRAKKVARAGGMVG